MRNREQIHAVVTQAAGMEVTPTFTRFASCVQTAYSVVVSEGFPHTRRHRHSPPTQRVRSNRPPRSLTQYRYDESVRV